MTPFSSLKSKFLFLTKNKIFWLVATVVFTIPSFSFLLKPGIYYNMHDDMQMIRQLELEKCLKDGQIPCRWTPDLGYGYGYPLFNFYPPLPYFIGQVYRTVGLNYMESVKGMAVTQILLASVFMFILAAVLFGNFGGFLAALFFTYAPYHAVNVYIRGAFNEAWASVFFPLNLFFAYKLIKTNNWKHALGLGLSFALTMLSHNPMVLTFSPILFIWCIFWLFNKNRFKFNQYLKPLLLLSSSALLALGLASFYFLPVILETKYVAIDTMFSGYYNFSVHFTSIRQLFFSNFWGDGASVWGQEDNMSFMVGYLHWILPLLLSFYAVYRIFKKDYSVNYFLIILLTGLGFFATFMTHERSAPIWVILTPIQKIQFPWRFLNHSIFLLSLTVGALPLLLRQIPRKLLKYSVGIIVIITLLLLNVKYFTPLQYGPLTDEQKFSGKAWVNLVTSGIYDYLPKTARIAPQGPANFPIDEQLPPNSVKLISSSRGTDWTLINLQSASDTTLTLAQLYFPDFKIYDFGKEIPFSVEPELGRMVVKLTKGEHQLYIKLQNTPVRSFANVISSVSWLIFIVLVLFKFLWKKRSVSHK